MSSTSTDDAAVTNTEQALAACGVRDDTLSADERDHLDRLGYLNLGKLLSAEQLTAMRTRVDDLLAAEAELAGHEVHQEAGTDRLADLANKGAMFEVCFTHPRLLAAVHHAIGHREMKLSSLNMRGAHLGKGHQGLHTDWAGPVLDGAFHVCNSVWMLDDFTLDNGPTRIVPGSHRSPHTAADELGNPAAPHPNQILLTGAAGMVVAFSSHLWHGGTTNTSERSRRALFCYFTAREHPQQTNQRDYLRAETYDRLTPAARYVLDV